ncbi:MAG: hypothetical protein RLZZ369_402, partial [Pseudomonadota bacterium]
MKPYRLTAWGLLASTLALSACKEHPTPQASTELGKGGSVVSGSAGPLGAQGADSGLVTCQAAVATLALAENPQ